MNMQMNQINKADKNEFFGKAVIIGAGEAGRAGKAAANDEGAVLAGSAPVSKSVTYRRPEQERAATSIEDIMDSAAGKDAVLMKNEMVVGAQTTTPKRALQLEDEGYSLPDADIHTIVTETDKIQATLAKAGKDVSYFTGDLTPEQLAEIAGSAALAAQYSAALDEAAAIRPLEDGAVKYMLDNGLEPTISNIYQAQYNGVYAQAMPDESLDAPLIGGQMEKVIAAAGMERTDENVEPCKWMAANDIAVTPEHLEYVCALRDLRAPSDPGQLVGAMRQAVEDGKAPGDAYLLPGYAPAERALAAENALMEVSDEEIAYVLSQDQDLTIENLRHAHNLIKGGMADPAEGIRALSEKGLLLLTARRMLEETRLAMTAEANYGLIKRGVAIELRPLELLVEDLKAQERDYYRQLLQADGSEASPGEISLFSETERAAEELKLMPAYALGSVPREATFGELHDAGANLKQRLDAAGTAYETLMTSPRADLGDSIKKAFRNVDDILGEIGMEPSDANARATRILAYNGLEITRDSVTEMKLADRRVQQAFSSLKPAVVREMIRDGINPLNLSMEQLNKEAARINSRIGTADDLEKYSEYLWKLERRHDITPEERDAYIGIYRLIHQVEAGDGAAIGALVEQGAEITMGSLLRAVRSSKKSGMDYRVDDDFGGAEGTYRGTSISDQINAAYNAQCVQEIMRSAEEPDKFAYLFSREGWQDLSPEQLMEELDKAPADTSADEAYAREELGGFHEAAAAPLEIYRMLERYDVPPTVNNVLAMRQLIASPNQALRRLFSAAESAGDGGDLSEEISRIKDGILEKMGENASAPEELAKAQEELAEVAERCGKAVMYDQASSLDVRELKMMSVQLNIGAAMAREERYLVPVLTKDGAVGISLRVVRGKGRKGGVRVTMDSRRYSKVAAELHADADGRISGYIASDSRAGADLLGSGIAGFFAEGDDVRAVYSAHLDFLQFESGGDGEDAGDSDGVQTAELYGLAEKIVRFLSDGITKEE